jgi:hypothetical protein
VVNQLAFAFEFGRHRGKAAEGSVVRDPLPRSLQCR